MPFNSHREGFTCRRDGGLEAIGYIGSGKYIAVIRYSHMSRGFCSKY